LDKSGLVEAPDTRGTPKVNAEFATLFDESLHVQPLNAMTGAASPIHILPVELPVDLPRPIKRGIDNREADACEHSVSTPLRLIVKSVVLRMSLKKPCSKAILAA